MMDCQKFWFCKSNISVWTNFYIWVIEGLFSIFNFTFDVFEIDPVMASVALYWTV